LLGRSPAPSLIPAPQLTVVVVRASRSWEGRGERLIFLLANNIERGVEGKSYIIEVIWSVYSEDVDGLDPPDLTVWVVLY
jgi:hypothetical protein